jgi:hypothetical protein
VVGVWDADADAARRVAPDPGTSAYQSVDECLAAKPDLTRPIEESYAGSWLADDPLLLLRAGRACGNGGGSSVAAAAISRALSM